MKSSMLIGQWLASSGSRHEEDPDRPLGFEMAPRSPQRGQGESYEAIC